jgi:hypothetical protein
VQFWELLIKENLTAFKILNGWKIYQKFSNFDYKKAQNSLTAIIERTINGGLYPTYLEQLEANYLQKQHCKLCLNLTKRLFFHIFMKIYITTSF